MNATHAGQRPEEVKRKEWRTEVEKQCRLDFLARGHDAHEPDCVCTPPCSRDYRLRPASKCDPFPPRMYAGTGIGALYGDEAGAHILAETAGWNLI